MLGLFRLFVLQLMFGPKLGPELLLLLRRCGCYLGRGAARPKRYQPIRRSTCEQSPGANEKVAITLAAEQRLKEDPTASEGWRQRWQELPARKLKKTSAWSKSR